MIDSGAFGAALGFIGYSTVLPTMALALSNSEPFVGLITTIWSGMWLLPQSAGGPPDGRSALQQADPGARRRLSAASRLLVLALALLLNLNPTVLADSAADYRGRSFADWMRVAAVAWFDVISKMFPPHVRGKILGWTQSAAFARAVPVGVCGGVGAWARPGRRFPYNYALLMGLAAVCVMVSWAALLFYVEPRGEVVEQSAGAIERLRDHVGHILKTDRAFRLNAIGRILIGGIGFATPFYVVQATQVLAGAERIRSGCFWPRTTSAASSSSLILGSISQRRGSHIVMRVTMILALIPPLMALLLYLFAQDNATLATIGTVVIFAAMGATDGSFLLGFLQHVLDIAPPGQRTAYTGLSNTIGGLTVIAPTIGGLLLQATSFPALFIVTMLAPLAGSAGGAADSEGDT